MTLGFLINPQSYHNHEIITLLILTHQQVSLLKFQKRPNLFKTLKNKDSLLFDIGF
jgi:hypothetical protein